MFLEFKAQYPGEEMNQRKFESVKRFIACATSERDRQS